ncbi:MAG: asparagine synthase (glutamine-hydrolyzing) [Coriobacteriia bacterium]
MCGITGVAQRDDLEPQATRAMLQRMADVMEHRGPDDEGFHVDRHVGLAARRLSIIDVEGGHQPVHSEDGRIWGVLNGEIYNFRELRGELQAKGHQFRSATDTEVLVHLYEEHGERMAERLRGIFSFAVLDERDETLLIGRDRLGVKPLYYHFSDGRLIFGSEIKVLFESGLTRAAVDPEALGLLLTLGYIPAPWTLYSGVMKLPPAHIACWRAGEFSIKRYWDFPPGPEVLKGNSATWERDFMAQLRESVATELVSDVPLGVMLSGGIDSAAITALTAEVAKEPVSTFHIGFERDAKESEYQDAEFVAQRLGTNHHGMTTELEDGIDYLARITWHMDEPIADLSALGFYGVCRLAREHVTVALAGQGGDELLAGYRRYWGYTYGRWASFMPRGLYSHVVKPLAAAVPRAGLLKKAARTLGNPDFLDWYLQSIAVPGVELRDRLVRPEYAPQHADDLLRSVVESHLAGFQSDSDMSKLLMLDSKMALPDDLLVHFDKMSMANSLEVRVPLLDYRFVEFCTRMPNELKLRGFTTKYALRRGCRDILPRETLTKRKQGFFGPLVNRWIRVEMREPIRELLLTAEAACLEYFDRDALHSLVSEHMEGREDYGRQLMSICMLELCLQMFVKGSMPMAPLHRDTVLSV